MRASVRAIHGIGDLVGPIHFTVPNNPFTDKGMGDLVGPVHYTVPNNPFMAKGMGHVGCGSDCGCGPCRSSQQNGGMGQIDFSLTGDGIASSIGSSLGLTSIETIPNWVIYAGAAAIAFWIWADALAPEQKGRRR